MSTQTKIINNAYQNLVNLREERIARIETGHGDAEDALMRDIYTAQMEGMQARFMLDPTAIRDNQIHDEKPIAHGEWAPCTACGRELSWMEASKGLMMCVAKNLCAKRVAEKRGR
jgi:hypothetical protein